MSHEAFLEITLGETTIWLDKNTEVKIIDGREDHETINVIQGRVVVIGDLDIQTREVITSISGTTSFVHYSWEDRIEIGIIKGDTSITIDGEEIAFENAVSLYTLPPYEFVDIDIAPEESTASAFYRHVLEE